MHMIKQEILPLFPLFHPIGYTEKGNWRTAYYSFLSKSQYHLIAFSQDSIGVTEKKISPALIYKLSNVLKKK